MAVIFFLNYSHIHTNEKSEMKVKKKQQTFMNNVLIENY